jgi:hypothetical protein
MLKSCFVTSFPPQDVSTFTARIDFADMGDYTGSLSAVRFSTGLIARIIN